MFVLYNCSAAAILSRRVAHVVGFRHVFKVYFKSLVLLLWVSSDLNAIKLNSSEHEVVKRYSFRFVEFPNSSHTRNFEILEFPYFRCSDCSEHFFLGVRFVVLTLSAGGGRRWCLFYTVYVENP